MLEFIIGAIAIYFIFRFLDGLFTKKPRELTPEEYHEKVMQVGADDLGCTVEEFKELLQSEVAEQRREKKPTLKVVK